MCPPHQVKRDSWLDPTGRLVASVWHYSDYYCFEVPGTAVFACDANTGTASASAVGETDPAVVRDIYNRSILPFFLHAIGFEALHAGAVVINDRVHAFCASSGTGKSTLVDGLRRRGYGAWADDCLALTQVGDQILTFPVPFHIRLAKTSPQWVTSLNKLDNSGSIPETYDPDNALTLPLGGIYILHRGKSTEINLQLQSLSPILTAIEQLITHAYAFSASTPDRRRRMITRFLNIVATVPIYRLDVPDDYGQLDTILNFLGPSLEASNLGWADARHQGTSSKVPKDSCPQ